MEFHKLKTIYDKARLHSQGPSDQIRFYADYKLRLLSNLNVSRTDASLMATQANMEAVWYANKTPEYKIHPDILDAMLKTSLKIDCEHIRLPYGAFLIALPKDPNCKDFSYIFVADGTLLGPELECAAKTDDLALHLHIGYPDGEADVLGIDFTRGKSVADCIDHRISFLRQELVPLESIMDVKKRQAEWHERLLNICSLVVATCFFATGRDRQQRFVTQDKPRNHHERRVLAKAQKCRTSEIVLPPKFTVGQDVVLPKFEPGLAPPKSTPEPTTPCAGCKHLFSDHTLANLACAVDGDSACSCDEFDTGRHLERGHIRSGHLHWYAVGPRKPGPGEKNDYVLKWVAPTVVRPDLPLAPVRSRIIKTPVNKIVSHTGDIES